MNNPAKVAVNLEKARDLFCSMCRGKGFGINEVNQTLVAMIEYMGEPSLEHSKELDRWILEFKERFAEKIFEN